MPETEKDGRRRNVFCEEKSAENRMYFLEIR